VNGLECTKGSLNQRLIIMGFLSYTSLLGYSPLIVVWAQVFEKLGV